MFIAVMNMAKNTPLSSLSDRAGGQAEVQNNAFIAHVIVT